MDRIADRARVGPPALSALLYVWCAAACEPDPLSNVAYNRADAVAGSLSPQPQPAKTDARDEVRPRPPADPCSDAVEPNDARGQAWLVDLDERIPATVCEGDVDWFAIDLPEAKVAVIRVESKHVERLHPIEAFRPRARKPFGALSRAPSAMELRLTDILPGRYRVRVAPRAGQPPTDYTSVVHLQSVRPQ